ncbi:MAG: winged helix-turn-helix transcriptional regulator [Actinomycetales bacterium]|nr:winged helix-turn-helix transcriptional regulator [Actinomycetales bacterium]
MEPAAADVHCFHLYKQSLVLGWGREVPEVNEAAAALDRTFQALADPHRRAILSSVRNQRCAVGEIAAALGLSQQIVSHHLKVLHAAGLVTGSRSGTRHLFAVRVEGLAVGKGFFDDFWPERLSALKRAAESSAGSSDG